MFVWLECWYCDVGVSEVMVVVNVIVALLLAAMLLVIVFGGFERALLVVTERD